MKRHGDVVDKPAIVNRSNRNNGNSSRLVWIRRREFCQMNANSAKFPRIYEIPIQVLLYLRNQFQKEQTVSATIVVLCSRTLNDYSALKSFNSRASNSKQFDCLLFSSDNYSHRPFFELTYNESKKYTLFLLKYLYHVRVTY